MPWEALAAAAATGVGNVAGAAVQNSGTKKSQKRAYKYNEMAAGNAEIRQNRYWDKTLADTAALTRALRDEDRAYNTYAADFQRLIDAGLSPSLFYSSGAGAVGSGTSAPSGETAGPKGAGVSGAIPFPEVGLNPVEALMLPDQLNLLRSNKQNVDADTDLKLSQAGNVDSSTALNLALADNTAARTIGQNLDNILNTETFDANVQTLRARSDQALVELEDYLVQLDTHTMENRFLRDTYDDRSEAIRLDLKEKASRIALLKVQARLVNAGVKLTDAQSRSIEQDLSMYFFKIAETDARTRYFESAAKRSAVGSRYTQKHIDWFNFNQVNGAINSAVNTYFKTSGRGYSDIF